MTEAERVAGWDAEDADRWHRVLADDPLLPDCSGTHMLGYAYCQRLARAAAQADTARPDDLDVAARAYLNDPDGYTAARLRAVLDTRPSRADTAPGGGLREALDDANRIISMTRDHLRRDHPDCAYEALGVLNDASRAALTAPSRDAGLDVERLARALRHALVSAGTEDEDARRVAREYADDDSDGAPFPAGVNRADSEGER